MALLHSNIRTLEHVYSKAGVCMEIIKNKKGKVTSYREKVYINNRPVTKSFKRKTDALAWKQKTKSEYQKLLALGVSLKSSESFEEFLNKWLQKKNRQNTAKRTIEAYTIVINLHLIPLVGKIKLTEIGLEHADMLIDSLLERGLSPKRTNYILARFKMFLEDAVKWDYLIKNPLLNIEYLKLDQREKTYWLRPEVIQFLRANKNDENFSLYLVGLNTGLRRGELLGLCWDCVDLKNMRISIKRQLDRHGLKNSTKSRRSREIQINKTANNELIKLKAENRNDTFVFARRDGKIHDPTHFSSRIFKKAIAVSNVKEIRFHDLRTTFACNWCIAGQDIFALSKTLGHSKIDTTIRNYADLHPSYMAKVCENLQFSIDNSPNLAHGNLTLLKS